MSIKSRAKFKETQVYIDEMMNVYVSALRRGARLLHVDPSKLWDRIVEVVAANWHLGLTAFGGPPVHFQILHKKFVEKNKWIDEQLYQEIFALTQALPGPASTKMLFCINYLHGGLLAGFGAFLLWCLPGAIGMYGLSLGVSRIGDTLPPPVYALLSGLNAATVGIIALAAVQLAQKAITDKITRVLVFLGGVVGMLYTALWFFPVLMFTAGIVTIVWDFRCMQQIYNLIWRRRRAVVLTTTHNNASRQRSSEAVAEDGMTPYVEHHEVVSSSSRRMPDLDNSILRSTDVEGDLENSIRAEPQTANRVIPSSIQMNLLSWKTGICVIVTFFISFITIMLIRGLLKVRTRGISLFANLYLAGTIIFGGGPVVIPLLREYIVAEGWVSPRDFLLGLALIQSFPGPNFNFAVYLGSLATITTSLPSFTGALIAFIGIFTPGIVIVIGVMGLWSVLRSHRWLVSLLRGINASAVGLVFTAVYKLWQIGYVDVENQDGSPLGRDPWWVAITATSFVGGAWFGLSAPFAILLGGIMGMVWYGVVKA